MLLDEAAARRCVAAKFERYEATTDVATDVALVFALDVATDVATDVTSDVTLDVALDVALDIALDVATVGWMAQRMVRCSGVGYGRGPSG